MSITFDTFCLMVLFMMPSTTILSNCSGVDPWGCPISSRVFLIGTVSFLFMNLEPASTSCAEDITLSMSLQTTYTATLDGGGV